MEGRFSTGSTLSSFYYKYKTFDLLDVCAKNKNALVKTRNWDWLEMFQHTENAKIKLFKELLILLIKKNVVKAIL